MAPAAPKRLWTPTRASLLLVPSWMLSPAWRAPARPTLCLALSLSSCRQDHVFFGSWFQIEYRCGFIHMRSVAIILQLPSVECGSHYVLLLSSNTTTVVLLLSTTTSTVVLLSVFLLFYCFSFSFSFFKVELLCSARHGPPHVIVCLSNTERVFVFCVLSFILLVPAGYIYPRTCLTISLVVFAESCSSKTLLIL